MSGDHTASTQINKDKLVNELQLNQVGNTTVFRRDHIFVLSPSVQSKSSWFDLREVNISRYNPTAEKGYLLIRFLNLFLMANLDTFLEVMTPLDTKEYVGNGGERWKFKINLTNEGQNAKYHVINLNNKELIMEVEEKNIDKLKELFN